MVCGAMNHEDEHFLISVHMCIILCTVSKSDLQKHAASWTHWTMPYDSSSGWPPPSSYNCIQATQGTTGPVTGKKKFKPTTGLLTWHTWLLPGSETTVSVTCIETTKTRIEPNGYKFWWLSKVFSLKPFKLAGWP